MIHFVAPEWWMILPLFVFCGLYWRRLRLWQPLRAVCLLLLVLLLTQPRLHTSSAGLDLWVLVDRSASAAEMLEGNLAEWEGLLKTSRSSHNRLFFVDFADAPMRRGNGEAAVYTGNRSRTQTAQAIRYALSQMPASRASRMLVITDGNSTEPLQGVAERLVQQHVPLDYRLLAPSDVHDFQVQRFALPSRVQSTEAFLLEVQITGDRDGHVPYVVTRDGVIVRRDTVRVHRGRGVVQFSDRLQNAGAHQYRVEIRPEPDARPGNNLAVGWVEVLGKPHVLLVTSYQNDPLVDVLLKQGVDVVVVADPSTLSVGHLSGTRAVILNNVAAYHIPTAFLKALDFFVRVQGGGLLMAGGENAFGSGGYFGSVIDPLLPVSMELREEHRQYAVAMAMVLDRSGSMSAGVAGGTAGQLTKMDLANEGAAEAIALLGGQDVVTVFAVDSKPHLMVPLLPVKHNRQHLMNTVRAITSQGGGIFVYTGLEAAWAELQQAPEGQKHIILFSDAADSEQPGNYKGLLRAIRKAGGTVSVIGLGTEADPDADLLKDIARRGEGRMFFAKDPHELPALFAQETVSVARSTFVDEPVGVKATGAWHEVAASSVAWLTAVDGYNVSYLRKDATAAAVSTDDYGAPLVAFWHRGTGRAAAVTFPLAGAHSQRVRLWPNYATFNQTLLRWLIGQEQLPGIGLQVKAEGTVLALDLLYADAWEAKLARHAPRTWIAQGPGGEVHELVWERMAPGKYSTHAPLVGTAWVRGAVQVGDTVIPFGPTAAATDPEWSFEPARVLAFKTISQLSGGVERLDLTKIWAAPARAAFIDLRHWLLILFLVSLLVETLLTRLGLRFSRIGWRVPAWRTTMYRPNRRISRPSPASVLHTPRDSTTSPPHVEPPPTQPSEAPKSAPRQAESARRQRFARAKQRGK